jgi:hypothetical protein
MCLFTTVSDIFFDTQYILEGNKIMKKRILTIIIGLSFQQSFCILPSSYIISKEELMSICASSAIVNFPISIEDLQAYPISDQLLASINSLVTDFWQEYELYKDDITISEKEFAFQLLAKVNRNMQIRIQNIATQDPQVKALVWIIWGYALLVIHYQIVYTLT